MELQIFICLIIGVVISCSEGINLTIVSPLFPLEAKRRGIEETWIGLIMSISDFCGLSSFLIPLVVTPSTQKSYYLWNSFLTGVLLIFFAIMSFVRNNIIYIILCAIIRILNGVCQSFVFVCFIPVLCNACSLEAVTIIAINNISYGIGCAIGPFLGSLLYRIHGFIMPYIIFGGFEIFLTLIAYITTPDYDESKDTASTTKKISVKNALQYASQYRLHLFTYPFLCESFFTGLRNAGLAIFIYEHFQYGESENFIVYSFWGFTYILISMGIGSVASKWPNSCPVLLLIAYIFLPITLFLFYGIDRISFFNSIHLVFVALILNCISLNSTYICSFGKFQDEAQLQNQSQCILLASTWLIILRTVGRAIGSSIFGGIVLDVFEFAGSCLILGILSTIFGLLASGVIVMDLVRNLRNKTNLIENSKD